VPILSYFHNLKFSIIALLQLRVWHNGGLVGNETIGDSTNSLLINNLNSGKSYKIQISAFTSKGLGPFSPMESLELPRNREDNEIHPIVANNNNNGGSDDEHVNQNSVNTNSLDELSYPKGVSYGGLPGARSRDHLMVTEAWFIALIGSIVFTMMLVFVFALYLRRCSIHRDGDKLKGNI